MLTCWSPDLNQMKHLWEILDQRASPASAKYQMGEYIFTEYEMLQSVLFGFWRFCWITVVSASTNLDYLLSRNVILLLLFQLRGNPTLFYYGTSVIHSQPFPTIQTVGPGPTSETPVYIWVPRSVKYDFTKKWFSWFVCKYRLIKGSSFCCVCFQAIIALFTLILHSTLR